jgi:hypothetical protein
MKILKRIRFKLAWLWWMSRPANFWRLSPSETSREVVDRKYAQEPKPEHYGL